MRLRIPLIVLKIVHVVAVACPIDLHRLQIVAEVFEAWLTVDAQDIAESHRARAHITEANHDEVQDSSELRVLGIGQPHGLEEIHVKLGWQGGAWC